MAGTLFNLDSANLFAGDDDPSDSQFLVLKTVKIPALEEQTKEHLGGGAVSSIMLGMRHFKIAPLTFTLEGFNPTIMPRFMPAGAARIKYTIRGNIRDIRTHEDIPLKAIVEGRMTKSEISEFKKDDGASTDYEINEILFYHLFFGKDEKIYFDYFSGPNGLRMDGVSVLDNVARNLGLS
jgi:phage tail tube protein FII